MGDGQKREKGKNERKVKMRKKKTLEKGKNEGMEKNERRTIGWECGSDDIFAQV
jgi:hypothetical protein